MSFSGGFLDNMESDQLSEQRTQLAEERTALAKERTLLANRRTMLAWCKAALGIMAFAIALDKFALAEKTSDAVGMLSVLAFGGVSYLLGGEVLRFRSRVIHLQASAGKIFPTEVVAALLVWAIAGCFLLLDLYLLR
jgi:putative membrane protein